ncbi:MAG: DUF2784 domain-containing protein [Acidiferrobacterales bacterium]|nr:DUF2784 domain-containing protein [Acidiferrobacterales bacterium]
MLTVLADLVLVIHTTFVLFVVLMVPAILIGGWLGWGWVRWFWLRLLHIFGIFVVVAQAWAGIICPLTTLEVWLRRQAGQAAYNGSFIQHWLQKLLYWNAPDWVFVVIYTLFFLLVIATWILVVPKKAVSKSS